MSTQWLQWQEVKGLDFGHNGPKGTFKLDVYGKGKYLFEILAENLKEANKKYEVIIPWYIMTSKENHEDTISFFEEKKYFGYEKDKIKFFKQGELPLLNTDGEVILNQEKEIKEAADGNGGIYEAIIRNGILEDLKNSGIEWIFVNGIDNILSNFVDPLLVGLTIEQNHKIASKSVSKAYPKEKVGVFCKMNGKPKVIEYIELPEEMAEERDGNGELLYGEVNIVTHLFHRSVLENLADVKLPYHIAFKKSGYLNKNRRIY